MQAVIHTIGISNSSLFIAHRDAATCSVAFGVGRSVRGGDLA